MRESSIHRTFGRQAFGLDPGGYHAARPAYPDWVFDVLRERCGRAPNVVTFEIGAGTGFWVTPEDSDPTDYYQMVTCSTFAVGIHRPVNVDGVLRIERKKLHPSGECLSAG